MPIHSTTKADHRPPVDGCSLHPRDCGDLTNWRHPSGASIACGSIAWGDGVETWEVWYAGDDEPTPWQTREQIVARLAAKTRIDISIDPVNLEIDGYLYDQDALLDAIRDYVLARHPDAHFATLQIGYRQGDGWARIDGDDEAGGELLEGFWQAHGSDEDLFERNPQ
jgi:hypothetical protein